MLCRIACLQCELSCHIVPSYAPAPRFLHQLPALRSSIRPARRANAFTSQAPRSSNPSSRQDPASTTCPRTRRPALRLVRSTILPAAPACRPKLYIPAPVPHKTSPLHHLPARSSSCAVVYHTPSASCPCVSSAAPRQESPPPAHSSSCSTLCPL